MKNWIFRHAAALTITAATKSLKNWLKTDSDYVVDTVLSVLIYIVLLLILYSSHAITFFTTIVLTPLAAYAIMVLAKKLQTETEEKTDGLGEV